jgi:hypothetical protein
MQNYNNELQALVQFLQRVSTTGINEANNLVACAVLVDKLLKGELTITESQAPEKDKD